MDRPTASTIWTPQAIHGLGGHGRLIAAGTSSQVQPTQPWWVPSWALVCNPRERTLLVGRLYPRQASLHKGHIHRTLMVLGICFRAHKLELGGGRYSSNDDKYS